MIELLIKNFLDWNKKYLPECSDDEDFEEMIVDRFCPTTFFLKMFKNDEDYLYRPDNCETVMIFKDRSLMRVINELN